MGRASEVRQGRGLPESTEENQGVSVPLLGAALLSHLLLTGAADQAARPSDWSTEAGKQGFYRKSYNCQMLAANKKICCGSLL